MIVGTEAVLHRDEVRRRRPGLVAFVDFDPELVRRATAPRNRPSGSWSGRAACSLPVNVWRVACSSRPAIPTTWSCRPLRRGRPQLVADAELERRAAFGLPPFGALAEVRGRG